MYVVQLFWEWNEMLVYGSHWNMVKLNLGQVVFTFHTFIINPPYMACLHALVVRACASLESSPTFLAIINLLYYPKQFILTKRNQY